MTTPRELALLRMVAQKIAGPGAATATEAVRWLTAMQAQDYPGALTSVALRTAGPGRESVLAALDSGEVVRSWPMRGTLHFVLAEDLPWMLALTGPRTLSGAAARHRGLGIDEAAVNHARDVAVGALAGGGRLDQRDLMDVWERAGIATADQRGRHLIWTLSLTGAVCLGPVRDGRQQVVLLDEWVPAPRVLSEEEALGEWVLRYFRSHGPATLKDFGWWTKLTVRQAKAGLAQVIDQLARIEVDGVEYYMDPRTPELLGEHRNDARAVHLLPGFDEFILGYRDRSAAVDPRFSELLCPGGNGMFFPTVVDGGQVVGTWKRNGRKSGEPVHASAFTRFSARVEKAIPRVYAGLG
ncbi:winged helix DNA-binding domain-containing protein [Speluncibacter jeojiensis]|uniref:Winged helix DNA-binding domain-containing protein n=1 Tax=Speluncibacter jeojiensis TaxID=2710754 RepID=A0A9X4M3P6_9ACTN|nr:winged helix DNA-binding domain-containing protein [Corynebacteriales bacterium D3-21]